MKHTQEQPEPPSKRLGQPVSEDLEQIIMSCLEKDPAKRPQTARELVQKLSESQLDGKWTMQDASEWWKLKMAGEATLIQSGPGIKTDSTESTADATLIVNLSREE